jgi:predicted RNA-binding Zn-ribbon protein involved in translation (DUF1610 family)
VVRAVKRSTATLDKQYYCENCEEWYATSDFTEENAYIAHDYLGEWQGESYYNDYTTYSVWTCDNCSEIVAVDQEPSSRVADEKWVCGECGDEYEQQDDARYCCD